MKSQPPSSDHVQGGPPMRDLSKLLQPHTIAVVGASNDEVNPRGRIVAMLKRVGFPGRIFPIHPSESEIQGFKAYPDVRSIPMACDLAIIMIPSAQLVRVLEDCATFKVKAAVILTGLPSGDEGERLQGEITRIASTTGLLVLGPNTLGYFNPQDSVVATFAPNAARYLGERRRQIGIVSQSGGIGHALYEKCNETGLGVGQVIMVGNEADVEALEAVNYILDRGDARVILMFIEGFRKPDRLAIVAAKAADMKVPLVILKVGSSLAGTRAAISHTAHLTGSDTAFDAFFERYGMIRVADLDEMVEVAGGLWKQDLMTGDNVAIVTTGGGLGGIMADVLTTAGFVVPELDETTKQRVAAILPDYGSPGNPIDLPGAILVGENRKLLGKLLKEVAQIDGIDAIIAILSLATPGRSDGIKSVLASAMEQIKKPILFHTTNIPSEDNLDNIHSLGLHHYSVLGCVKALLAIRYYTRFQQRWQARKLVAASSSSRPKAADFSNLKSGNWTADEVRKLLDAYGIPRPREALVQTEADALSAGSDIGYPLALKVQSQDIPHKTEAGAVALNIRDEMQLRDAYSVILASARQHAAHAVIEGVQVQQMMPPGREVAIGVTMDKDFGPLIMLALGGIYIDVFKDSVFSMVPVDLVEAHAMIAKLKGVALLRGVRGEPASDVDALARLLVDVSRLVADADGRLREIDFNPVLVYSEGHGVSVVDALVVS